MRTYPNLGISEAFHPLSHHQNDPAKIEQAGARSRTTTRRCSRSSSSGWPTMKDGDGSLLDHSIILFGSNMSNSDLHNNDPLPIGGDRPRYGKHQGRPAPALSAGHAAREPAADDAGARRRAATRSSATAPARSRRSDGGMRSRMCARPLAIAAALRAAAGGAAAWLSPAVRHFSRRMPTTAPPSRAIANARKPDGSTPLQWAVYDGDAAEVQRLLKAGADVHATQQLRRHADAAGGRSRQPGHSASCC